MNLSKFLRGEATDRNILKECAKALYKEGHKVNYESIKKLYEGVSYRFLYVDNVNRLKTIKLEKENIEIYLDYIDELIKKYQN